MSDKEGPPGPRDDESGPSPEPAAAEQSKNCITNSRKPITAGRLCAADTVAGLRRRRQASQRLVPLDCGSVDGWTCRFSWPPLSEKMVDGGRAAALHLFNCGLTPLVDVETRRALWRRDRALAERLHAAAGGEVA
jgi:hypothetical protein